MEWVWVFPEACYRSLTLLRPMSLLQMTLIVESTTFIAVLSAVLIHGSTTMSLTGSIQCSFVFLHAWH